MQEGIGITANRIYSAISRDFSLQKLPQICEAVLCNAAAKWIFLFKNHPKNLDPSYKTDLDFLDCFRREFSRLITEEIVYQSHGMRKCAIEHV